MADSPTGLTFDLIDAARERLAGKVSVTPVMSSATLSEQAGAQLYFKCENLQKGGAFKARGATNAVFALSQTQAQRGVATHSSGNHGAALARAAQLRGIPAYVVMPTNTARAKSDAVRRFGAEITWCEPTQADRERAVADVIAATGATLVHPYNDLAVMAGQGTATVEFLSQVPQLEVILCPVGGGGLLAGTAVAAHSLKEGLRVIGVEPAGADDAARSLRAGRIVSGTSPETLADGLRATVGALPFAEIRRRVEDIITVTDEAIVAAMRQLWSVMKLVVEPSGAVPYAPFLTREHGFRGAHLGIILTGGNLDLDRLPWALKPARE